MSDDNRRVVERTTHPAHLNRIAAELAERDAAGWSQHVQGKEGKVGAELGEAQSARLDWRKPFDAFRLDADEHIATRLGAADRQLELPGEWRGPFGIPVTVLRVPHFLLEGVPSDAEPSDLRQEAEALLFQLGVRKFRYDRFGLARAQD